MWTEIVCLAALACGVNVGWKPHAEGGMEYLIQIEPYMLDSLRAGTAIESDVPPNVKDIRSFSITVGTKTLPQESPRTSSSTSSTESSVLNAPTLPQTNAGSAPKLPSTFDMSPLPLPKRVDEKPAAKKPTQTPAKPSAEQTTTSSLWSTPPATGAAPAPLLPDASGRPLVEQHAAYLQPTTASAPPTSPPSLPKTDTAPSHTESSSGSWFYPFVFAMVALAGSLSWNGFLVWSLSEARRRYRELHDYHKRRGKRNFSAEESFASSEEENIENAREHGEEKSQDSRRGYGVGPGRPRDGKNR